MQVIEVFNEHTREYEEWFEQYPLVFNAEILAIREHMEKLPASTQGIEVGLGTGRFSSALGIKEGVEPAASMREIALTRGLEVMNAVAERLPYRDMHFDFVLMVTILCYLPEPLAAIKEAHRVLKPGGRLIIAFIDKDSDLARYYEQNRAKSIFYKQANFHTIEKVKSWLQKTRFKKPDFNQTIFRDLVDIDGMEQVKEGYGEGSFVVVSAVK